MPKFYRAEHVLLGDELKDAGPSFVEVDGARIVSCGSCEELKSIGAQNLDVIDLGPCTLMPGMVDAHNHMVMDFRHPQAARDLSADYPAQLKTAQLTANDDLLSGVTSSRYLGDRLYVDVAMRELVASGETPGPKASVCGIGMKSDKAPGFVARGLGAAEAFSETARRNLLLGVDFLKLFMTGTLLPENESEEIPFYLEPEMVRAAVSMGLNEHKYTAAHCIGGQGLRICVDEGVTVIEHGYGITARDIELLLQKNIRLCLTPGVFMDEQRDRYLPAERREAGARIRERVMANMSGIIASGLFYATGTDAMHCGLAREAKYICQLGAANRDAVRSVTINAAELSGTAGQTGSLLPGKCADMIAVRGDPLEDISALERVAFIMQDGKVIADWTKQPDDRPGSK
jgi:imidazolonepropionase-like amidohydrolase